MEKTRVLGLRGSLTVVTATEATSGQASSPDQSGELTAKLTGEAVDGGGHLWTATAAPLLATSAGGQPRTSLEDPDQTTEQRLDGHPGCARRQAGWTATGMMVRG